MRADMLKVSLFFIQASLKNGKYSLQAFLSFTIIMYVYWYKEGAFSFRSCSSVLALLRRQLKVEPSPCWPTCKLSFLQNIAISYMHIATCVFCCILANECSTFLPMIKYLSFLPYITSVTGLGYSYKYHLYLSHLDYTFSMEKQLTPGNIYHWCCCKKY